MNVETLCPQVSCDLVFPVFVGEAATAGWDFGDIQCINERCSSPCCEVEEDDAPDLVGTRTGESRLTSENYFVSSLWIPGIVGMPQKCSGVELLQEHERTLTIATRYRL